MNGTGYLGGFFIGCVEGGNSIIRNSFTCGNVASGSNTAGFAGYIYSGKVENCYSTSNNTNGFVFNSFTVTNCYFDSTIAGAAAKTEARLSDEMKKVSSYTGWNFDGVWMMEEGSYPVLSGMPNP